MQKEREREGDEFADKESFVTQAYKDQMAKVRLAEEEEKKREGALRPYLCPCPPFNFTYWQPVCRNNQETERFLCRHDPLLRQTPTGRLRNTRSRRPRRPTQRSHRPRSPTLLRRRTEPHHHQTLYPILLVIFISTHPPGRVLVCQTIRRRACERSAREWERGRAERR